MEEARGTVVVLLSDLGLINMATRVPTHRPGPFLPLKRAPIT